MKKKTLGLQILILLLVDLFANVKRFSFYFKPLLGQC